MKKRILSGLFALALLITAGYGVSENLKSGADFSDLALMNVEALAQDESGDGETLSCWKNMNSQETQTTPHKTYCGTCAAVPVHTWSNESTCKK